MWDVEYSVKDDKERLKGLYNISFVGDEEFAEWYFDHLWKAEQTLVIKEDGAIVSALQMLPLCFGKENTKIEGCYVFAVCTDPISRGRGLAGALIEKSTEICKDKGLEFCALIAREPTLLEYYARFGFKSVLQVSQKTGKSVRGECILLSFDHIEEISKIYRCEVGGILHTERDRVYWQNQMSVYKAFGLKKNGKLIAYCFGDIRDSVFYAVEACGENTEKLVGYAAYSEGTDEYKLLSVSNDNGVAIGCIKPLSSRLEELIEEEKVYLNLYFN